MSAFHFTGKRRGNARKNVWKVKKQKKNPSEPGFSFTISSFIVGFVILKTAVCGRICVIPQRRCPHGEIRRRKVWDILHGGRLHTGSQHQESGFLLMTALWDFGGGGGSCQHGFGCSLLQWNEPWKRASVWPKLRSAGL